MIIILKNDAQAESVRRLEENLKAQGVSTNHIEGVNQRIIGLVGDTSAIDVENILAQDCVENIKRVQEPYKQANRKFHPDDTVIPVKDTVVGNGSLQVIAGPCSVESEEQVITTAIAVKEAGATMLRGGAFKPRTSPYSFQGLGAEGIKLLVKAKAETGLPIVTEIMNSADIDLFADVDIIQVGARNMQNFELLKALGSCDKPILLKRGLSSTLEELLMSAEYIMSAGNSKVIFCERGIRTFETMTRNTMDISAIPLLKQKSHLPVCADPSHATGMVSLIETMSLSAVIAGADALEIEVHNDPKSALSDGGQQLTPAKFADVMVKIKDLAKYMGRTLGK